MGQSLRLGTPTVKGGDPAAARAQAGEGRQAHAALPGIVAVSQGLQGLALQRDGKFVVVGSVDGSDGRRDSRDFAVSRYTPNGALDPSFGRGGKAVTDLRTGAIANAISVQTNGKIVAAGTRGSNDFALVRYLTSGKLDGRFGRGGRVLTDITPVWARR
jgi:uncharacterized delta-60 repeat protein